MVEKFGLYIFLFLTFIYDVCCMSSYSMQCVDTRIYMRSYCEYGCCGNGTMHGWGTLPCCDRETTPQYIYLLLAIGLLIPCAICLMILRRAGERCRRPVNHRPSRRAENLRGTMPSRGDRRLMVATIADLLYNSRRHRESSTADIVYPPSYDDAVKESYDEIKPPEYSEVFKMQSTTLQTENDSPPEYTQSEHSNISNENTTVVLSDIPSTSRTNFLVLDCNSFSSQVSCTTENTNSESCYDNNGFSPESAESFDDLNEQRQDTSP